MKRELTRIYYNNQRIFLIATIFAAAWVFLYSLTMASVGRAPLSNDIIRLHILAHDDSPAEQALKLEVRDAILSIMHEIADDSQNIADARLAIAENMEHIADAAQRVVASAGFTHNVYAELSAGIPFPAIAYGPLILQQGTYEALQVFIGDGQGQNWWCIMFPAMCIFDIEPIKLQPYTDELILRPRLRIAEIFRR